jgi:hypothetical protein
MTPFQVDDWIVSVIVFGCAVYRVWVQYGTL